MYEKVCQMGVRTRPRSGLSRVSGDYVVSQIFVPFLAGVKPENRSTVKTLSKGGTGMTYALLRFGQLVGLTLMGVGLIGLFVSDLRSRNVRGL
jgi:hypothetical protein